MFTQVKRLPLLMLPWLLTLLVAGCDAAGLPQNPPVPPSPALATPTGTSASPTPWVPPTAVAGTALPGARATLTAAPALQKATLIILNDLRQSVNMTVEVADSGPSRELGLMFRSGMAASAGMLFDFGSDTDSGFWMQNTILPLSIAFITADGRITSIQDMRPLDTSTVSAPGPYRYALETNQGFFAANNISVGDQVTLPGALGVVIPGMPDCAP